VLGAEGSPTCGIDKVGRWKNGIKGKKEFPRDIEFVPGRGVFMEEFEASLETLQVHTNWVGIPGKSIRSINPDVFGEVLRKLEKIL
jgi:hypothetical protein